jgi:hypothetical protein
MNKELKLNLERDILEGWEDYDLLNVEVLRMALKLGHNFPRVDVVEKEGIYRLIFGMVDGQAYSNNYGGHSRAIASLQDGLLLPCSLIDGQRLREDPFDSKSLNYRPIQILKPVLNKHYNFLERLRINLGFLPEQLKDEFVRNHDLVWTKDKLVTRENYENPPPF